MRSPYLCASQNRESGKKLIKIFDENRTMTEGPARGNTARPFLTSLHHRECGEPAYESELRVGLEDD